MPAWLKSFGSWIGAAFRSIGPKPVDVGQADVTVTLKSGEKFEYTLIGSAMDDDMGRIWKRTAQTVYKMWPSTRMSGPLFRITDDRWIPSSDIASITAVYSSYMVIPE